ncbi:MAG: hypothetical protein DME90_04595 [Verrucomicrobia bacterium]|nr:MAG: hypothetical protein DME90_04595 [Verrucomicrobiota bacterium]
MRPVKSWSLCLATETLSRESASSQADPRFLPVSYSKPPLQITGKITATPNPVPFGEEHVVISWDSSDEAGAELRVSTSRDHEQLVSRGRSGSTKIPWIAHSTAYEFRLYAASQPDLPIATVKVTREVDSAEAVLRELAAEVMSGNVDTALSRFIAVTVPRFVQTGKLREMFPIWERHGFHVTPVHFYQPLPDTQSLPETLWHEPSKLVGIEMNDRLQLDLLRSHFPNFRDEYESFSTRQTSEGSRFHLNNDVFDGVDALVDYCMVRYFQPRLIIEVGSGYSSLIMGEAAAKNDRCSLVCIEPFPSDVLSKGFPGLKYLVTKKVQDVDVNFFAQLEPGDILFIDSSHTVKIGGDVNFSYPSSTDVIGY